MSTHEQFADDLALYALGVLEGEGRSAMEGHLRECPACSTELQRLRGDMSLMALSALGPKPPQRSRQRLLDAMAREPRQAQALRTRHWWSFVPWLAAATLAIIAVGFWLQNRNLRESIARLENQAAQQQAQLQRAREVVETLTASDALRITVVAANAPPQPQGKAIYVRDRSSLIFLASNMPKLPPEKAYELWLIPTSGAPIPAGVFKPDARGSAQVIEPPLPAGVEAKTFAITIEPEQGSSTPTMPVVMVGAGG
ncbi:MAG TPA: anti-sigma factor [Terriglobales bacterium]|nr:anti-sigma factor [Terriglobales bacterium]